MRAVVHSVIGFNFNVKIVGPDSEPLKTGFRTVTPVEYAEKMASQPFNPRFFTNFNQALLDKVRDFKTYNN